MAFTHRRRASTNRSRKNKTEYIKGTLKSKDFENLAGSITVQLAEDTNAKSKRVAYGSLIIAGCFVIYISVYEGKNGYFISYPNYKDSDDEYHDLAYCMDVQVIEGLKDLITEMIDGKDEDDDLPFEG